MSILVYSIIPFWNIPLWNKTIRGMKKSIHTKERAIFVDRLKKARSASGLTQTEVAEKLGCTQSYISKIESGELRVEAIWLAKLAALYKKSPNYFVAE
jgi:ribosome-binding protein aMBF1 (putative translation factor)